MSVSLEIYEQARNNNIVLYLKGEQLAYVSEEGGFPSQLKEQIREHKDSIICFLKQMREKERVKKDPMLITPVKDKSLLPLSYAQQGLWFVDKLEGGSSQYNIPAAFRLRGCLNIDAIHRALDALVERHEVLRSVFVVENGEPFQRVTTVERIAFPVIDLSGMSAARRQQEIDKLLTEEMGKTFDLSKDLMLRAKLLRFSDDEHIMMFTMHHIVSDGWSQAVLVKEFVHLYDSYSRGVSNRLPTLEIQYGDYANWQRKFYGEQALEQQFTYWQQRLEGAPKRHSLPLDFVRLPQQKFSGRTHTWMVDEQLCNKVKAMAKARGTTLFMVLYSVYSVVIGRWSQTRDVVIGSPIAGRTHPQVAPLIGYFINSIVYRSQWQQDESFADLLEKNRVHTLVAYDNQNIPLETLVDKLKVSRELSHSPIFQLMFTLQNNETSELNLSGLEIEALGDDNDIIKYDMEMEAAELDGGIQFLWNYSTYLFNEQTVKAMADSFNMILAQVADNPSAVIEQLNISPEPMVAEMAPKNGELVHHIFEQIVNDRGSAIAVEDSNGAVSYEQLNRRANQLARHLHAKGFKASDTLYIGLPNNINMYVAMLGALKAGGSYCCDELKSIIDKSSQWLIVDPILAAEQPHAMIIEESILVGYDDKNLNSTQTSTSDKALIYGTHCLSHEALYCQAHAHMQSLSLDRDATVLLMPSSRSVSASDWLGALFAGAKLLPIVMGTDIVSTLTHNSVTHVTVSAGELASIPLQSGYTLQRLCVAHSSSNMQLLWKWAELYSVCSALHIGPYNYITCTAVEKEQEFNLGRPNSYHHCEVRHQSAFVAPIGAIGSLNIQGHAASSRIDVGLTVRKLPDGSIELLARQDQGLTREQLQVEQFIGRQVGVEQVAVVGNTVFVCFDEQDHNAAKQTLQQIMKHSLPTYMLPEHCIVMTQIPTEPCGRVDRKAITAQTSYWLNHLQAYKNLPVRQISRTPLVQRHDLDFSLEQPALQALGELAHTYSLSLEQTLCVALTLAEAINENSSMTSFAVSGLRLKCFAEPISSTVNINYVDEALPVSELFDAIQNRLTQSLSFGGMGNEWVREQYNQLHYAKRDTLYAMEVNFKKPDNLTQKNMEMQDVNVAGVLLQIDTIDLHRAKGKWYVDTDLYNSSAISALTSSLNAVLPWLIRPEVNTLVEVKRQLKEQVRNRMRSAKRKFKPGGIRK